MPQLGVRFGSVADEMHLNATRPLSGQMQRRLSKSASGQKLTLRVALRLIRAGRRELMSSRMSVISDDVSLSLRVTARLGREE
jgi:hypothetical protein